MKLLLALLTIPSLSWGANVTQAQVKSAKTTLNAIQAKTAEMIRYASYADHLFDINFELIMPGSTSTVTVPTAVRNELIGVQKYQQLKGELETLVNSLP